ncbi:hypothetical protein [Streptomyces hoynatensis]|uniref:hypothetical protein n=1 Tax=Streptomyces hoynatensis TaxID=1141874 RepID=UPI0011C4A3E5|nr:hypothetical protein [Streptomyces hoynatensis]
MAQRVHRPSVPGDLGDPPDLWVRAATLAMLAAVGIDGDEYELSEDRLRCDNAGGSYWWRLTLHGEGRAVFCGQDADGSHGHLREEPVDFLAGGPDWLPLAELRAEQHKGLLGYAYWWEGGAWHRAPYPEDLADDGLELSAGWVIADEEVTEQLWEAVEGGRNAGEAVAAFLGRARARTVDAKAVAALLGAFSPAEPPKPQEVATALEFATRAALTA